MEIAKKHNVHIDTFRKSYLCRNSSFNLSVFPLHSIQVRKRESIYRYMSMLPSGRSGSRYKVDYLNVETTRYVHSK